MLYTGFSSHPVENQISRPLAAILFCASLFFHIPCRSINTTKQTLGTSLSHHFRPQLKLSPSVAANAPTWWVRQGPRHDATVVDPIEQIRFGSNVAQRVPTPTSGNQAGKTCKGRQRATSSLPMKEWTPVQRVLPKASPFQLGVVKSTQHYGQKSQLQRFGGPSGPLQPTQPSIPSKRISPWCLAVIHRPIGRCVGPKDAPTARLHPASGAATCLSGKVVGSTLWLRRKKSTTRVEAWKNVSTWVGNKQRLVTICKQRNHCSKTLQQKYPAGFAKALSCWYINQLIHN